MIILSPLLIAFIHLSTNRVEGYGAPWPEVATSEIPEYQRPVEILTDVINELGVRILQEYGETRNGGNVAFSPTGIGFVLAALYEGSTGPGNEQIAHVLGLPRDRDITRIGLRDIHRRLRSYLSPDGFLGGLTLNRENTKLRPEYEEILKFLGFDLPSGDDGANATDASTSALPEEATEISSPTGSETTVPSTTSDLEESPTTVASRISEETMTTTMRVLEEVAGTSTELPKKETTTSKVDDDADAVKTSEPPTTTNVAEVSEEISTAQSASTASAFTTTESPTTVPEMSSRLTEASSATSSVVGSTEAITSTEATTTISDVTEAVGPVTEKPRVEESTSKNAEEVTESFVPGATTLKFKDEVSREMTTTTPAVPKTTESTTTMNYEEEKSSGEIFDESETTTSTLSPEESREELTTTSTEISSTSEPKETSSNEVISESTTVRVDTTTPNYVDEVETLLDTEATDSELDNLLEMTTASSSQRRTRKIGIRDPVVRSLLDPKSREKLEPRDPKRNSTVWVNRVVEYFFTEENGKETTTVKKTSEGNVREEENEDFIGPGEAKNRGTRSSRSYFSNFPDFPSFPIYPDFSGFPEETFWTRKFAGWRVHSPKTDEIARDSSELNFLVNGEDATVVSAATYTVVLPFAYLPNLQALALEFPLDDPRYNILLLLPTDRDGTRRLARELGNTGLREIRKELQPAWVRAMIPSFMLKGFVTLTPFLQRLGIRDVFEPRDADLSLMTDEDGVYARDVQQSIGVNIRNYMKPDRTHSSEWNYYQAEISPPRYLPTPEPRLRAFRNERYDAWLPSWRNYYQYFKPGNGLFERAGPVSFVAEHPFLFFIIDAETGVSLIAGRIENPLNSRIL